MAFEPALRTVVRASYEQASDDRWRRAFPALLLAKTQGQLELDRLRSETEHDERARFEELLQRGVAEGAIAPDVTMDDVMLQIAGRCSSSRAASRTSTTASPTASSTSSSPATALPGVTR
jgi:tetracycline repressor-like protein